MITVKLNEVDYKLETLTLRQYAELTEYRLNNDNVKFKEFIKKFVDFPNITRQEKEFLFIHLYHYSTNENGVEVDYLCDVCGSTFKHEIDLGLMRLFNYKSAYVHDFNGFKIHFEMPDIFADDNIPQMIVDCIKFIYFDDEVLELDDLDDKAKSDLFSRITQTDVSTIKDNLLSPTIKLDEPVKCDCGSCGAVSISTFGGFLQVIK